MPKLNQAISEIEEINKLNQRDQWINRLHPLVKLSLTVIYLVVVVSFDSRRLSSLAVMALYPWFVFTFGDLSFKDCLKRLRLILPLVILVGIFNPILDREPLFKVYGVVVTSGLLSMAGLILKGVLTVVAVYLLIVTTSIEDICFALRLIHVPKAVVTVILLIYRYLFVMIKEVEKVTIAYNLRAPGQKGVHISAWGSLVGQILLRSMDRAEIIYEAMLLRGFDGEFKSEDRHKATAKDIAYGLIWLAVFVIIRFTNVINILGGIFL
ncbi:MAG: cobalt ECF transporter T component CbiQ [Pseudobutyrivibrio sp.]|nr:cobalt ECF transporter T component CbiQ [Pseudobutyrivibrio sp.]